MPAYTTGELVNGIGGIVFALLGLLVLLVRPRERLNRAFAFFAVTFGARFVYNNLGGEAFAVEVVYALNYLTLAGFLLLAAALPRPLGSESRARIVAIAVATVPLLLYSLYQVSTGVTAVEAHVRELSFIFLDSVPAGFIVLLALRYRRLAAVNEKAARMLATLALAVGIWLGYQAGIFVSAQTEPPHTLLVRVLLTSMAPFLLAAIGWLAAQSSTASHVPRTVAWLLLATAVLAALLRGPLGGTDADVSPGFGISRIVGALILSYAIVRHQMFGLDRKVRFTIKSTTLGTIFVVAFFVASEAAQQFFGERANSAYVGIAAAGALVFALSPLQRLAERVAAAAVGNAGPPGARAEVYRETARRLMADGSLSPRDERILARLAQELGIGAADALELRLAEQKESVRP